MLVPTLPEARYLILDDADLASLVSVALAGERWGGQGPAPVVVPAWWRPGADDAMPLVHKAVARHAGVYGARALGEELVVEPGPDGAFAELSDLLLAAARLARNLGCDSVLFPVRAADLSPEGDCPVGLVAREVDRAALVSRLASLDLPETPACQIVTPLVDFDDEQLIDLARDLSVPSESCWWAADADDSGVRAAAARWRELAAMPAGPAPAPRLTRTA